MVALVSFVVFAGAFAASVCVIIAMIAPQWRRIATLAMGQAESGFSPLATLVVAERRIAVRRRATPFCPIVNRLRAAA